MDANVSLNNFNFKLMESFNCIENPHGELDQSKEDKDANKKIYGFKSHITKVRFCRGIKNSFVYTLESLQYVYIRNYMTRHVSFRKPGLISLAEKNHHLGRLPKST
jgi:hypothetical protein